MCNLYSVTKGQQAIRELYPVVVDRTGNLPPLPGIFPDQMAPVVRSSGDGRELKPENRCLVPATSFCEYPPGKPAVPHWFPLGEDRPLFAFAGLWRPWTGTRGIKAEPASGAHELFAFLTCEPNAVVAPVHPKAIPSS